MYEVSIYDEYSLQLYTCDFQISTYTVSLFTDTFQCCTAAENLRKKYAELSDLPYNAMQGLLYAKKVITREEKKCIKTLVGSEKMECLLDVVIRSLKHNHCHKFKGFLEAMEESEDMLLKKTAKDLGEYFSSHWY